MNDGTPIPPRQPEELHRIIENVKDKKHLLKIKLDKSWNPIGVTTQSKDDARSGLFGRIIVWIHAAEYDLEKNVKHLKNEIEQMQREKKLDSQQFIALQTKYNDLIDVVATQKFQKRWYNFFTKDKEIEEQREKFKAIKFTIEADTSSERTKKAATVVFPTVVARPQAESRPLEAPPPSSPQPAVTSLAADTTLAPLASQPVQLAVASLPARSNLEPSIPNNVEESSTAGTPLAAAGAVDLPQAATTNAAQDIEEPLGIGEGASPSNRLTLGGLTTDSAEGSSIEVPIEPGAPVVAASQAVRTNAAHETATAEQEEAARLQEISVLTPLQKKLNEVQATLAELTNKFTAINQEEHSTLGEARIAVQALGKVARNTSDWKEKVQLAVNRNEVAKSTYLELLKDKALDRALKISVIEEQTTQVVEAMRGLRLSESPHTNIQQLKALEQAFQQIDIRAEAYQTAKGVLDALEVRFETATLQLKAMQATFAKAIERKKEALRSEIQRLQSDKAIDKTLGNELATMLTKVQNPLVIGKENDYGIGLQIVEDGLQDVTSEIKQKKQAFALFSSTIQKNQNLLQGKLTALPKDRTVSTALKRNYLNQVLKKIEQLRSTTLITTPSKQIRARLFYISAFEKIGTFTTHLQEIDKAAGMGFSLDTVRSAFNPVGDDELQIVELETIMVAIDTLSLAVKGFELLQEKLNNLPQSDTNQALLQYQREYIEDLQKKLKEDPEKSSSINFETIDQQLQAMREKFTEFEEKALLLTQDLERRQLPTDDVKDFLKRIFACRTRTADFAIQINETALTKLQDEISQLPEK